MTAKEAIELLDAIARRNVFCTLDEEQLSAFELAHIEKNRIKEAAKKRDRSMASFVRMVLNEYFEKETR